MSKEHYTVVVQVKHVTPGNGRVDGARTERQTEDVLNLAARGDTLEEAVALAKAHLQTTEDNL